MWLGVSCIVGTVGLVVVVGDWLVVMVGDWLVVMVGDWLVVMVGDLRAGCRSSQRGCMVHGDAWCAVRGA